MWEGGTHISTHKAPTKHPHPIYNMAAIPVGF